MNIKIDTWCQYDCTLGRLQYGDFHCFTLELPWRDNRNDVSCIPAGMYKAVKYQSPTKGWVLLLVDVPDRSNVEVHAGNYTRDVLGCILVGDAIEHLDGDDIPDVVNSKVTLNKLLEMLPDEVTIEITRTGGGV